MLSISSVIILTCICIGQKPIKYMLCYVTYWQLFEFKECPYWYLQKIDESKPFNYYTKIVKFCLCWPFCIRWLINMLDASIM